MLSSVEEVQKVRHSKSSWFLHVKDMEQTFPSFHSATLSLLPLLAAWLLRIHSHRVKIWQCVEDMRSR